MFEVFKYVDKFFTSLTNYLTYNDIFIIFVGLFLFTTIVVTISTAHSYEAKLIKAIDKFNAYFIDNPQINEENLVAFNAKMKARSVPKQLRKSWQQFVLYRENKASSYMSFENCVSNPIKNSSYKRDTRLMNVLSYIFGACALILNCYYCYETSNLANVLSSVLLTPVIILLLNYIMQIFFNVKHSAIVSDLFQNYQYFEVNIDKATETLPEYVDYEVLFDRNEIKKGIPILYAYLQKRAEEEQRELERARLKNVEHEKFNFDDAGVEASLVLERAMQEAENYIAERKKYNQDTEQINSDMTQEDMNYREITKEYNRQMQVSRETFANFKAQLEEVSSTIEANYLKKQQQQELDRQRNLERDFDTATERHKKIIENFHNELDTVDKFIAESRKSLENAMKSEFSTYSSKVYDEAYKVVEEREKEKFNKLKSKINELEEELVAKSQELEKAYSDNQEIAEELDILKGSQVAEPVVQEPVKEEIAEPVQPEVPQEEPIQETQPEYVEPTQPEYVETVQPEYQEAYAPVYDEPVQEYADFAPINEEYAEPENYSYEEQPVDYQYEQQNEYQTEEDYPYDIRPDQDYQPYSNQTEEISNNNFEQDMVNETPVQDDNDDEEDDGSLVINPEYVIAEQDAQEETIPSDNLEENVDEVKDFEEISTAPTDDSINEVKPVSRRGRPRKVVDASEVQQGEKKKRGRPRKEVKETQNEQPKRKVGRPKKVEQKAEVTEQKKGRGRPRKVQPETVEVKKETRGRGRPRKETMEVQDEQPKRKAGRPRKEEKSTAPIKKGRGRPRKEVKETQNEQPKRKAGRPRKEEKQVAPIKKGRGRPKKVVTKLPEELKLDAKADSIVDIDEYIRQIDNAIAEENAKLEETQKELAKNAKLRNRKK